MTEYHLKYRAPCTYVTMVDGAPKRCGRIPTRRFLNGWYCDKCARHWEAVVASWANPRPAAPQDTAKRA
ncbi:hypothetical protein [Nonomuraea sp. NPDC052265]|uniref:hypothetical protein n=1 Tax=Nonomuraea sp. NPDC052265 TaxID=3364374 RepID=UPI0037C6DCF9